MYYFDTAARQYDADFSLSQIGIIQRNQVYDFLSDYVSIHKPLRILELNCGTGIDAFYFARAGHQVVATDASQSMIDQCMSKMQIENINLKLSFLQCDISNLSQLKDNNFDLVFSNFSGFNCLNENDFANSISQIQNKLNDNGKFIAVLFGTKCLMERIYFFFKFQFEKMNRREKYQSNFNGTESLFYYSSSKVESIVKPYFSLLKMKPIGVFIPPSYLEEKMKKHKMLFVILQKMEKLFAKYFNTEYGDHYIIAFEKKQ